MLMGVTISGVTAEDVERCGLNHLAAKYPFVEWGQLYARVEDDRLRYCSQAEIVGMNGSTFASGARALHLCGEAARNLLTERSAPLLSVLSPRPARLQLNWDLTTLAHAVNCVGTDPALNWVDALWKWNVTPILQVHDEDSESWAEELFTILDELDEGPTATPLGLQVLFDGSRGKGLPMNPRGEAARARAFVEEHVPLYWRKRHLVVGFAGGIRPDNVEGIVRQLREDFPYPFWIDMESGVRTDRDELDRAKIETVLERASGFLPMSPPLPMTGLPPAWARFWGSGIWGCEAQPKPPEDGATPTAATEAELAWAASPMGQALAGKASPGLDFLAMAAVVKQYAVEHREDVLGALLRTVGTGAVGEERLVQLARRIEATAAGKPPVAAVPDSEDRARLAALDERVDALEERVGNLASLTAALDKARKL